ncbi:MAG: VWA domain-containing protein, partial [Candidatus Altiarchaeales archaeon]|nr:VWA domain-containing protein [Candidatus Altiarchaeales archaeon]
MWGKGGLVLDDIKIEALQETAVNFIDLAFSEDVNKIGLASFSAPYAGLCGSCVCSSHALTDSSGTSSLKQQIEDYDRFAYREWGGTCASCGIRKGWKLLEGAPGGEEKYMIFTSDGIPNYCAGCYQCAEGNRDPPYTYGAKKNAIEEVRTARSKGITIHSIALGGDADITFMKEVAKEGGGEFFEVTCECALDCIYIKLVNLVNDNVVLVNDVSASMKWRLDLECPLIGNPVIHKNIMRDIDLNITGRIDNEVDKFITHKGILNITVEPDIINRFVLNVGNESLTYSSLLYPVKHELFGKQFMHGKWGPAIPYTLISPDQYGDLPSRRIYVLNESYGYEGDVPTPVGFDFPYPSRGREICPPECFCPAYDLTDVTCINYS